MKVQHRTARDFQRQTWRNGGGSTTELAVERTFLWRLSVAEVERSGPFSDFAGYERTIMLLEGEGMALSFDATEEQRLAERHRPFVFDGGWKTDCRLLGGPVRDLNLMVDRSRGRGSVRVLTLVKPADIALSAPWELLYVLEGIVEARIEGASYRLKAGELLRLDDAQGMTLAARPLEPGSRVARVSVEPMSRPG
jgi:uncharacterized protein